MINPFTGVVKFLTVLVEGFNQWTNPENKRLRTKADYQKEIESLQEKLNKILFKRPKDEEQKNKNAIALGSIAKRIIWLRNKLNGVTR